jgi:hypothetical protein
MNYFTLLLILSSLFATSQKITIQPNWKPGETYHFKLTYSIVAPELGVTKESAPEICVYNSLKIIDETTAHWSLSLEYDSIQLNGNKMDYAAKGRLWKAMKSYKIALSKDTTEMAIENFDQVIVDYLDIVTGKSRDEKYDSLKTLLLDAGGGAYLLDGDYGFLFVNYLKAFDFNKWNTIDSLNEEWKSKSREKMKKLGGPGLQYVLSEEYEIFAKTDTINNYVTTKMPVFVTLEQTIEYGERHVPVLSNKVIFTDNFGMEYKKLDSGFERKIERGTITETVKVELIDVDSR